MSNRMNRVRLMSQDFDNHYKSPRLMTRSTSPHLNSPETHYIKMMQQQQFDYPSLDSPAKSTKLVSYPESESKHWQRQEQELLCQLAPLKEMFEGIIDV